MIWRGKGKMQGINQMIYFEIIGLCNFASNNRSAAGHLPRGGMSLCVERSPVATRPRGPFSVRFPYSRPPANAKLR
ncbi:hypothetical protein PUN4_160081 [Paraburkholderia unamae]|nr:hypothetical protein PUN4_160081 [Paraburkholderia unamae]